MRYGFLGRFIAIIFAGLTLAGCIHYEHRSAEGKPNSEIAMVQQQDNSLAIIRIDGDQTLYWLGRQDRYSLGAGRHQIQVRMYITAYDYTSPIEKTVDLVAGHTYGLQLHGKSSIYWSSGQARWDYEIHDMETDQRADLDMSAAAEKAKSSPTLAR